MQPISAEIGFPMGRLIVHLGCRVLGSRLTSICDFASRVLGVLNERRWKEDTRFSSAPLSTLVLSSFLLFKGVFTFSTVLVCARAAPPSAVLVVL